MLCFKLFEAKTTSAVFVNHFNICLAPLSSISFLNIQELVRMKHELSRQKIK